MAELLRDRERTKILIIISMIVISLTLSYYFHFFLEKEFIYTHFLYIPAIISCFWWGRKGIYIVTLIIFLEFLIDLYIPLEPLSEHVPEYVVIFSLSILVAFLSERRRKMEEKLKEERDFFETVYSNMDEGLLVIDKDYRIMDANKSLSKSIGVERKDILGKFCYEVTHNLKEPCDLALCLKKETFKTGKPMTTIHTHYDTEGNEIFVEINASPIRDEKGNVFQVVEIWRDITERKKSEKEILEAKNTAEFLNDLMGHDIRNLVQVVIGYLEILEESLLEDQKKYLKNALNSAKNIGKLIGNVKKLQGLKLRKVEREIVDFDDILRDTISEALEYPNRSVEINYSLKEGQKVYAGPLLKDVFSNLFENAIKFDSSEKVLIDVEVTEEDGFYRISIADRGKGIPDDAKLRIFKRFERHDKGVKGSGLGLYLARRIVENFGGKIWVEDRVKGDFRGGSKFVVELEKVKP
ncbi:MAG: ATP-binding protein [Candidatus Methanofastidiosia archaeon]